MRWRVWSILSAVLCLATAGCGGGQSTLPEQAFQANPTYSEALNVLMASGHVKDPKRSSVRDLSAAELAQATGNNRNGAVDAGYAVANAVAPPPGIGAGLAVGTSVVSLLVPPATDPLATTGVLAWMPRDLAATPEQARERFQAMLEDALNASVQETLPPDFGSVRRAVFGRGERAKPLVGRVGVTGGECNTAKVSCAYEIHLDRSPVPGVAPSMLGGGPSWVWKGWVDDIGYSVVDTRSFRTEFHAWLPDLAVYRALSGKLPKWVYIYLAPGKVSAGKDQGFLKYPVVLNQGRMLYFVSPASKS